MFKLQDDFKAEDGYHVVELHSDDEEFAKILLEAMKLKGYDVYGFSDRGGSKQYAFVTAEFAEVLKERHHASCRNSLGGALDPQMLGRHLSSHAPLTLNDHKRLLDNPRPLHAEVDPQCIGRAFREPSQAEVVVVEMATLPAGIQQSLDRMKALDSVPVDLQERGVGSRIMGSQASGIEPIRTIGYLEPGLGARCFGSGNLDD